MSRRAKYLQVVNVFAREATIIAPASGDAAFAKRTSGTDSTPESPTPGRRRARGWAVAAAATAFTLITGTIGVYADLINLGWLGRSESSTPDDTAATDRTRLYQDLLGGATNLFVTTAVSASGIQVRPRSAPLVASCESCERVGDEPLVPFTLYAALCVTQGESLRVGPRSSTTWYGVHTKDFVLAFINELHGQVPPGTSVRVCPEELVPRSGEDWIRQWFLGPTLEDHGRLEGSDAPDGAGTVRPHPPKQPSKVVPPPPATRPQPSAPRTVTLTVYNKVTNGSAEMREDTPAYLSTVTKNYCRRDGCMVAGTEMNTGATVTGLCWVTGDRTTNGEDAESRDDGNPGLFESTRWYRVRHGNGSVGYISEVWIDPGQRGGAGLGQCT
jgi:hypothetical protein